jgi:hypothetical protein
MKLGINEVSFIHQSIMSVNIKGSDAVQVAGLIEKLEKEFTRLQKLESKNNGNMEESNS